MRLAPALLLAAAFAVPAAAQQKILPDKSFIRFKATQMSVPVEGAFRKFDGTVTFDPARPEATKASFEVDTGSIDLGLDEGTEEVKRKLWLDVAGFPKATFAPSAVKALGGGKFEARGPLVLKGITGDIVATFTVTDANGMRTVEGMFPLKRLRFHVGEKEWADTDTVADDVLVRFRFALPLR